MEKNLQYPNQGCRYRMILPSSSQKYSQLDIEHSLPTKAVQKSDTLWYIDTIVLTNEIIIILIASVAVYQYQILVAALW